MPSTRRPAIARCIVIATLAAMLAACATPPTRTPDPLQGFNRKMYAVNTALDKAVLRPVARGYVHITTPAIREHVGDFFTNILLPVTIFNEFLQGRPGPALDTTARFLINSTAGVFGFFDPATRLDVPSHNTDFGVTLADWGIPSGPYLVLPFIGPTTFRDVWKIPVDSYADPLWWYAQRSGIPWYAKYSPEAVYFVSLRASLLPFDKTIDSAFDPYAFVRDAYLQHRVYMIYHGNPPLSAIEQFQQTSTPGNESNEEIEKLLQQQREYEKTHKAGTPSPAASSHPPPRAEPATPPASAASVNPPPAAAGD